MSDAFIGQIEIFSFGFAPRGWAQCNGQLLSITQNQALFALLGTHFGGSRHGCSAVVVAHARIRSGPQQSPGELRVTRVRGPVKRSSPIDVARARISSGMQQARGGIEVIAFRRPHELQPRRAIDADRVRGERRGRREADNQKRRCHEGRRRSAHDEPHQTSAKAPVLLPNFSSGTPTRLSIVSSRLACGVSCG